MNEDGIYGLLKSSLSLACNYQIGNARYGNYDIFSLSPSLCTCNFIHIDFSFDHDVLMARQRDYATH